METRAADAARDGKSPHWLREEQQQRVATAAIAAVDANGRGSAGRCRDAAAKGAALDSVRLRPLAPSSSIDTSATSSARGGLKTKKRKPTQVLRKEEKGELLREIEALQLRVQALEAQPPAASASALQLTDVKRQNALFHEAVRSQQLSLATTQSVVSGLLSGEHTNPLSMCIRLGTDRAERRAQLLALKERKIAHACEYVAARSRFLDPLQPHIADERFATARGDFICVGYEVVQFTNVAGVKQVYDAYVSYLLNLEISVSERLGYLTVRDDFDFVEGSLASYRFLTSEDDVPVETHGVLFLQFFESHEMANGGPCGVVMIDCVEDDELYPYLPSEAVRKDAVIAVVITPHVVRSKRDGQPDELVVAMASGKYFKLHHSSQCPLATPEAVERLRKGMTHWGDEMLTTLHEILHTSSAAAVGL